MLVAPSKKKCLAAVWGWLWPRLICALMATGLAYVAVEVALPAEQEQRRATVAELAPEHLRTVLAREVPGE